MKKKTNTNECSIAARLPVTRVELWTIVLVSVCGAALRASFLSRAAVEHFDEGVYASNAWFDNAGGYPFRHLYAPPLFPTLVEWSIVLLGIGHVGTMAVNLLVGSATIVLVWWVGRAWFGPPAGVASATLAAFSDFHILYSRTVLTDPLLCFWMLAAVYLIWEALRRQCLGWAMMAGIATAAAWWTKYNGWLPLAIGIAGLVPWLAFHRPPHVTWRKTLALWIAIAATAFALWSPVLYGLSDYGGYAAVQANHRGYIVGLTGWAESFNQQFAAQRHFDWLGVIGIASACFAAMMTINWRTADSTWNRDPRRLILGLPVTLWLVASAMFLGVAVTFAVGVSVGLLVALWTAVAKGSHERLDRDRALAWWLLAAWFIGLLAVTPLYRPYPRLMLPWLTATWLGGGAAFGALLDICGRRSMGSMDQWAQCAPQRFHILVLTTAVAGIALLLPYTTPRFNAIAAWQDRTGLESIAERIVTGTGEALTEADTAASGRAFYVYGEPPLVYHLFALGQQAVPVGDLGFAASSSRGRGDSSYLIAGPHAERTPGFTEQLAAHDRYELVATYEYQPSDFVLLDEHPAQHVAQPDFDRTQTIRLYRVK